MMAKLKIKFETIEQVKQFNRIMETVKSDTIIRTENRKYAIDAKSIMGIFSLDLSNYLILEVYGHEDGLTEKIDNIGVYIETIEAVEV